LVGGKGLAVFGGAPSGRAFLGALDIFLRKISNARCRNALPGAAM
jgi:hypothetical protein